MLSSRKEALYLQLLLGYDDGCVNNGSKGSGDASGRGRNRELPADDLDGDSEEQRTCPVL